VRVLRKQCIPLFVGRSSQQWVLQNPGPSFWILPSVEHAWEQRQPLYPTVETYLLPVPGHYRDMLGLPF
jgi:hypothetical protein